MTSPTSNNFSSSTLAVDEKTPYSYKGYESSSVSFAPLLPRPSPATTSSQGGPAPPNFADLAYRYGYGGSPGTVATKKPVPKKTKSVPSPSLAATPKSSSSNSNSQPSWSEPRPPSGGPSFGEMAIRYGHGAAPGTSNLRKKTPKSSTSESESKPDSKSSLLGSLFKSGGKS